jgi:hypothetical protein
MLNRTNFIIGMFIIGITFVSCASSGRLQPESAAGDNMVVGYALDGDKARQMPLQRLIQKSANLTLEADSAEAVLKAIAQLTTGLNGYVVEQSSFSGRFRILSAQFDKAMAEIARLGDITSQNVYSQDVTDQYYDQQIRIDNLRKIRERYLKLLEAASNVDEAIQVEKELGRITMELDVLEGQQKRLTNQTEFSTFYIRIEKPVRPGPLGYIFYGAYHAIKWLFVWN